ncbi:MAG: hypothetical protein U0168_12050 [Nannocystaceae bacterium]
MMLPWLLGSLLGGGIPTAAPAVTPPDADVTVRAAEADAEWMVLGGGAPLASSIALSRFGAVRLDADAPPVAEGDDDAHTWQLLPVLEQEPARARVRFDRGDLALLVWIDLADAAPQLQRPAVLRTAPGREPRPDEGHVELAPGVALRLLARRGDWSKVALRGPDRADWIAQTEGWVESAALGPLRREAPFAAPRQARGEPHLRLHRTAHGKRGGAQVIATLPAAASPVGAMRLRVLARRDDATVEAIHLCQPFVRVRGHGDPPPDRPRGLARRRLRLQQGTQDTHGRSAAADSTLVRLREGDNCSIETVGYEDASCEPSTCRPTPRSRRRARRRRCSCTRRGGTCDCGANLRMAPSHPPAQRTGDPPSR